VIAAGSGADDELIGLRSRRIVAVMRLAKTAGMRGRSGGRQRERNECSGERKKQQDSGGQAMHGL